jgi:lipopolysaccharide biosynthesis glycosyltransferase
MLSLMLSGSDNGVVLAFDAGYVWAACVNIRSLVRTWTAREPLIVYCLCDLSVGAQQIAAIEGVAATGPAEIRIIQRPFAFPDMRIDYITAMGYGRVVAPELIEAGMLVYLDCDTVACTSVDALFRPIGADFPLAAVRDPYIPELGTPHVESSRFPLAGRGESFPYFNSGVLVIDVARWRQERITQRADALIEQSDWRPLFGDQDTLNYLANGRFELLDQRWNVMPVSAIQRSLDFTFHGERYTPMPYQESLERSPWIMHYATEVKPWTDRFPPGPLRQRWQDIATEAAAAVTAHGLDLSSLIPPVHS